VGVPIAENYFLKKLFHRIVFKKIMEEVFKGKENRQGGTKVYLYSHSKDIKSKSVNGGFWRRLKYVGFDYEQ
jgi:hypothetical protein